MNSQRQVTVRAEVGNGHRSLLSPAIAAHDITILLCRQPEYSANREHAEPSRSSPLTRRVCAAQPPEQRLDRRAAAPVHFLPDRKVALEERRTVLAQPPG